MYIVRNIEKQVRELAKQYPFVAVTGPRQSGKTTLVKTVFKDYDYVSLEELDNREFATRDPRGFIATYPKKVIIDEVQRVPNLLSYLQVHADTVGAEGMYILTGSQNFSLIQAIDQSLAGRVALMTLLPLSHDEIVRGGLCSKTVDEEMFRGCFPRIYNKGISPTTFYSNYTKTYVERDIRTLKNITDLSTFVRFLKLCAGRIGQLLNMSSLANDCGVSVPTVKAWISALEASYVIMLLKPDYNNFSKRLVKTPKLYFCDTGLACSLLEITSAKQLATHYLRGGLFENLVIVDYLKNALNEGRTPEMSFWRDNNGNEVDLLIRENGIQQAVEIKSGQTYNSDFFKGLKYWSQLSGATIESTTVIYAGDNSFQTSDGLLKAWR